MVAVRGSKTSRATVLDDYGIENVTPSFVYSVMLAKARYKFTARTKASNDSLSQDLILLFTANSIGVQPHSEGLSFPSPGVGGRETSLMTMIEALQTFCSELKKTLNF